MARALLVGCGCRGRAFGRALLDDGWLVRGTTRSPERLASIEEAGIEAVLADPERPGSILDQVGDVAVVCWLLGSARGDRGLIGALHGRLLERLLERLVDTPVRGFLYDRSSSVEPGPLAAGSATVRGAAERWRIPVEIVEEDPREWRVWTAAAHAGVRRLVRL